MSFYQGRFTDVQAVLFDLDGTLIDSAPDLAAAADKLRTDRNLSALPFERYRPMVGAGARGLLGVAFDITPEHADFLPLREEFFLNYENCMTQRTDVFSGVPELLSELHQRNLPWGIVTNKASRFALPLTKSLAVLSSAGVVICGDTTAHSKPHPEPLLAAARRLDVNPVRCLYVGDDLRDIQAGVAAGMGTVAATYGYLGSSASVIGWGADAEIGFPEALLRLL